jgi:hypothetical protein
MAGLVTEVLPTRNHLLGKGLSIETFLPLDNPSMQEWSATAEADIKVKIRSERQLSRIFIIMEIHNIVKAY